MFCDSKYSRYNWQRVLYYGRSVHSKAMEYSVCIQTKEQPYITHELEDISIGPSNNKL